ncbi:hypothetical protein [Massilia sp. ST3]|uniref:hypothetical protein n=1 Tax=Massilia sp. ST3 TaxID=2824903 RepID=UPI001B822912|nr:hypothetical protein [Massilia sp. ST3]MBQ5946639.1 hypothetical protein [Massilia sp. ST3]
MPIPRLSILLSSLLAALLLAAPAAAREKKNAKDETAHEFAFVGNSAAKLTGDQGEDRLKRALKETSEKSLDFVVLTGIKGDKESCGDRLYQKRRDLIEGARRPVIVSLAGSDWTGCRNSLGRTNAIERLNRLRELLYGEATSLGEDKLPVSRLSTSPRFRSYAENAHWQVGKVVYATINLPAGNNHFLPAAGRNSEYEDRMVANRFWLNRLFAIARNEKAEALVLFAEGDARPLLQEEAKGLRGLLRREPAVQDGFAETRRQIQARAGKFKGKVLLVDSGALKGKQPVIEWRGNLGQLSVGEKAVEVKVSSKDGAVFSVGDAKR